MSVVCPMRCMRRSHVLPGKFCYGTNGLNTIKGHDKALKLPHVLHCESQAGLRGKLLSVTGAMNLARKNMLIGKEFVDVVFNGFSHVSVSEDRDEFLNFDSLKKVTCGSQVFVLFANWLVSSMPRLGVALTEEILVNLDTELASHQEVTLPCI